MTSPGLIPDELCPFLMSLATTLWRNLARFDLGVNHIHAEIKLLLYCELCSSCEVKLCSSQCQQFMFVEQKKTLRKHNAHAGEHCFKASER